MSDYTPETGNIRVIYTYVPGSGANPTERAAAFDRWLAARDREVSAKVLDDLTNWIDAHHGPSVVSVERAIVRNFADEIRKATS